MQYLYDKYIVYSKINLCILISTFRVVKQFEKYQTVGHQIEK